MLQTSYFPTPTDITNGAVTLTLTANSAVCPTNAAQDSFVLYFEENITVNAGPNATICEGVDYAINAASAPNAVNINWTSSGTGTFFNQQTINPIYYPSNLDITNGSVVLTLTASGQAPCNTAVSDALTLSFVRQPIPNAGADIVVCETGNYTITDASASNYSTLFWSTSGTGTISDGNTITPTYTPSNQDITNGFVILTLRANSINPPCAAPVTDSKC